MDKEKRLREISNIIYEEIIVASGDGKVKPSQYVERCANEILAMSEECPECKGTRSITINHGVGGVQFSTCPKCGKQEPKIEKLP